MSKMQFHLFMLLCIILGIVLCCADAKQCTTDSNCAAVWDDVSGFPY